MEHPKVVNATEAAQILGIARGSLRRLSLAGQITPIHKTRGGGGGGATIFLLRDVERLAAQRAANPPKRGPKPKAK